MNCKRNFFLIKLLFLLLMVSLSTSSQVLVYGDNADLRVLARVEVTGMLNDLNLPVYAHLQDGAGKDYALVIAPQAQLDQAGVAYRILDKDTGGVDYFILSMPSGDNRIPMSRLAKADVLLDEGKHFIIRSTFKQAEALAEAGFEIQWVDHTPMVITAPTREPISLISTVTYDAVIASMMGQVTQATVETYDKNLSGVNAVTIGGSSYTIATRNTTSGTPITKATQYVYEFMQGLGLTVSYHNWSLSGYSGRNVIGQITGTTLPNEIVLITAHLDDMPSGSTAPGADDNASGSVGVMVSAQLLSAQQFARTVRFVFFTGEEQGLLGSAAYSDLVYGSGANIVAVYNMDMISYDAVGLPYLRLHTRTSSNPGYSGDLAIANTLVDVVNAYSLSSVLSPIITSDGESRSDHASFWGNGYYGILGIEDHINDITPYYHLTSDTFATLNLTYFTNYVKASVGTAAHLAIRDNGVPAPPVANFSASTTNPAVGGSVTFTDTSTNIPTSWSWTFAGGTPASSTVKNPVITYNTIGTYNVSLTATNAQGSDIETKVGYITVSAVPYCASQGNTYTDEWIARVQVGTLNNASGAAGYTDFTGITVNLTGGNNAGVTLTPGFGGSSYTEYWKIWIDYNGDHDFVDTGEEEFSGSGTSAVSGSFAVNTGVNITTRMRVSMKYNAAPTSCETFSYGEVEDYTATISGGTPQPPVAAFIASATTVQVGGSVTFTDQSTNTPTSWSWAFQGGTPSTGTAQNPTVTYNTVGTYDVTLTATNASGSDQELKVDYITVTSAPTDDIAEGVDYASTFTKSGNANWAKVTDVYYYGGDSAKSGVIGNSQSTTIETSVTVGSTQAVKFYWKVSSEANYDYLRFYIDGVQKNQISGTVDWTQVSNNIAAGTHTLKWTYLKDASTVGGSDCGWVDKLEIAAPTSDPIAEAVDYPGLTFTLSGTGSWYSQTTTTYYGGDAAQSPVITHSQSSSMETAITGKTTVKFYWKVSSETNYDYLRFYIDGVLKNSISGTVNWAQKTYTVTSGAHTLKWTYVKDASASSGSDCGWVDKLELL